MTQKPKLFYGWFIVFLSFMTITTYGLFYSYSLFLKPLETDLHTSRVALSAVYSIYMAGYSLSAVPMGLLSDKYGPRKILWLAAFLIGSGIALCSTAKSVWQLSLYFGVIASLGHGAIFVVPTSTINRWFLQRRGLAVGIAVSGLGIGLLIVPPLTSQIITVFGWRTAFIILAITFFLINGIVGIFIRGKPEDKHLRPLGELEIKQKSLVSKQVIPTRDFTVLEAIKTKTFWMIYMVCLFCFAAEQMVLVHIVPYSTAIGLSSIEASLGLSFLGVGTIIGRITSGHISDKIGRVLTLVVCCCIEAVSIFCLLLIKNPATLYSVMFFLGIGYGGWVVLSSVMLGDFFGLKNLGVILGIWFTSGVPSGILGPLMGGVVFDATSSYFWAIFIGGVVCIIAVVLAATIKYPGASNGSELVRT